MQVISDKKITKFIAIIFIIVTMLFSNFVPIISWALTENQTESQYIKFDLNWGNNTNEISMNDGSTTAYFDLQFDTINMFTNFRIEVEGSDLVSVGFSNSGEYFGEASNVSQIQYLKDIPGGTKIEGTINFKFNKAEDFSNYSKDLTVKLIGTYELDGEEINVEITKNLKANITSTAIVSEHTAYMGYKKSSSSTATSTNTNILYVVSQISETYEIQIVSANEEHTKLEFELYRKDNNDKIYYPTSVTFSDASFKFTTRDNGDGTYTYVAEKGEQHEEYASSNLYSLNKKYYVTAKYTIENANEQQSTTVISNVKLTSDGYTTKIDGSGTTHTNTQITRDSATSNSYVLYRYTPGYATWGNSNIYTDLGSYFYSQTSLQEMITNGEMNLPYRTRFSYISGVNSEGTCKITQSNASVRYYDTSSYVYKSKTLTDNEMYVKTITVNNMQSDENAWIKFYKNGSTDPFFTATADNLTYTADENMKVGSYYAVANNIQNFRYSGWDTNYEISASAMKSSGLTEEQILNIRNIYKNQSSSGANIFTGTSQAIYTITGFEKTAVSNFAISADTKMDSDISQVGQDVSGTINIYLGKSGLTSDECNQLDVSNTNPVFYVKLPDQFDFDIKSVNIANVNTMKVSNYNIKKVNGSKILQINCEGIDTGSITPKLAINYTRRLKPNVTQVSGNLAVYMKTDEDEYFTGITDSYDYDADGNISDKLAYDSIYFSILYNSQIKLSNSVYSAFGEAKTNENVILNKGETAKYRVVLDNNYNNIKKINLVTRLPFEGNKNIVGSSLIDLGSSFSLTNLQNIKVYVQPKNGTQSLVNSNQYTIGYSIDEVANLDSEFTTNAEDIATAKTLQIKFADTYIVYKGYQLILEYEADIPEETQIGEVVAETSAVRYTDASNVEQVQEAASMKVVVGDLTGTVEVVKSFEGTTTSESLEGIRFKITNMDDESKFYEGTTDANGHYTFNNVPIGDWEITETTQYNNYQSSPRYVKISNGEKYTEESGNAINIVNEIKESKIEIIKKWEDTNDIPGQVTFKISGTTVGGDSYNKPSLYTTTVKDDEGNNVSKAIIYVPYGSYKIEETYSRYGWYADDVTVEAKSETVQVPILNKITKGTLQINKTVPTGDTVEGLTFKITGTGDVSYTNKLGENVVFNTDTTIEINESNPNVTISEDKKQATITLKDLPVGTYKIEETNMPTVDTDSGEVTSYVGVTKYQKIPDENGKITIVSIDNKHKTGKLNINVTASEGIELGQFKVKVSGTSYYGTQYSKEFDVPSSGKITISGLEIGKYTVEECNTKVENGKIVTTNPDGFVVTYNPASINTNYIELKYQKTENVTIHNEYSGVGFVKIVKTLEKEEDVSKAEGIKFKITGKDLVGKDVDETITIGSNGIGTSNEIPVGTYQLSEVEETVPEIYAVMEDKEITITTKNTESSPLNLDIDNKLAIGKIVMETELATGGYPETPVKYSVTKVDNNLDPIEDSIEITGNRNSYAELENLKSGKYLVEQKEIPEGYIKDTRQVVNITRYETGYALFVIDKEKVEELENTKVIIEKEIVNEDGNIASTEDFEEAKIDNADSYSFEVKIQNVNTKEVYYSFINNEKADTIVGLPYGTYTIEEIYKPKFKTIELVGERVQTIEGKYVFTLSEDQEQIENTVRIKIKNQIDKEFGFGGQDSKDNLSKVLVNEVEQQVTTKSKIYIRDDENNKISDATFKLYDSNGNIVKLTGSNGIYLPSEEGNEEISPVDGVIILKTLPVGNYKLVNETTTDEFLKSMNRTVTVYKDAVGVTRIELLRNIPRGTLRLSTIYTTDTGTEKYVARSKYKILNPATDEVLTFIKKADGTYERSNLPNAVEKISLKAGYIDVTGIEAGTEYEVGIVDLTEKYGVIKETPELVTVVDGESKDVTVNVKDRSNFFTKVITPGSETLTVALDKEGKIWAYDDGNSYMGLNSNNYQLQCINDLASCEVIKDVRFKDINVSVNISNPTFVAIDTEGKVWTWGYNNYGQLGNGTKVTNYVPTCISNIEGNALCDNNVKIKKVAFDSYAGNSVFVLDEQGKIWYWGRFISQGYGIQWLEETSKPRCMSDLTYKEQAYDENWEVIDQEPQTKTCALKDIVITDICNGGKNQMVAIDSQGKVWTWGYNYKSSCGLEYDSNLSGNEATVKTYIKPTCISDIEGSNIKNVKIKKAATGYTVTFLIDEQNHLWAFGTSDCGLIGNGIEISSSWDNANLSFWNPICLNYNNQNNPLNGIGIVDINCQYSTVAAADENGKLWTWGQDNYGQLGTGERYTYDGSENSSKDYAIYPMCITDLENNSLEEAKIVSVSAPYYNNAAAIDSNGCIWFWGQYGLPLGYGNTSSNILPPTKLNIATNSYFAIPNFTKVKAGYNHSAAIDEEGRVWTWGYDNNGATLGNGYKNNSSYTATPVCVGGYNNSIRKEKIVDIDVGYSHTLALDSEGKLWAWGYNCSGTELGYSKDNFGYYSGDPKCITTLKFEGNTLYGKKISKIEAGYEMSAVIDTEGKLYTFGYNGYGQIGNNTINSNGEMPVSLNDMYSNLGKIVDISIFNGYTGHMVALDENGKVWTWGKNDNGQLGCGANNEDDTEYPAPICISDIGQNPLNGLKIKEVSGGSSHTVALDEEGKVWIWGSCGQDYGYTPVCLSNNESNLLYGKTIETVLAGNYMTLAIDNEGKIYTWGSNSNGQLGQNTTNTSTLEISCINNSVDLLAKDISLGEHYILALDNKGSLWSWGSGEYGKSGRTTSAIVPQKLKGETNVYNPTYGKKIESISQATHIAAVGVIKPIVNTQTEEIVYPSDIKEQKTLGGYGTIALDNSGNLWTWGTNSTWGILGDGTTNAIVQPKCINEMLEGATIKQIITANASNIIVEDIEGNLWTWGSNIYGQLGIGTNTIRLEPVCITKDNDMAGKNITSITAYGSVQLAIDEDGKIYTWGVNNANGTSGNGITTGYSVPTCISNDSEMEDAKIVKVISINNTTIFAVSETGKVYSWGVNNYGQCGTGTKVNVLVPTQVGKGTSMQNIKIIDIKFYNNTVYAIGSQGELYTWGVNTYGQLGTGTTTSIATPTCINSSNGMVVKDIWITNTVTVVDTNGKLWKWGQNNYGQCGTGTTTTVTTPTCVSQSKGFTVKDVILYATSNIIVDTQGRMWTWGYNSYGQLGTGTTTTVTTPTCISQSKGFTVDTVLLCSVNTIVLKDTQRRIWIWGYNSYGICGTGNTTTVTTPTCISTGTDLEGKNIISVKASGNVMIATDDSGKLYTWGQNNYGQCGTGSTDTYATPACINNYAGLEDVIFEKTNIYNVCTAIDSQGKKWTWGSNAYGELGVGVIGNVLRPICIDDVYAENEINFTVQKYIVNTSTKVVIDTEGKVWTWGANASGLCGTGTKDNVSLPTCISEANSINLKDVATSYSCGCIYAITKEGTVWVWGAGITSPTKINDISPINGAKIKEVGVTEINSIVNKIAVLTEDGTLYLVPVNLTQEVTNANGIELLYTVPGTWETQFTLIKDALYAQ